MDGYSFDPTKLTSLSIDEKRDIIYALSRSPEDPSAVLQSWSRKDLLEVLCLEMGKERKYTSVTKIRLIEHLMGIVSEKILGKSHFKEEVTVSTTPSTMQLSSKRQRKDEHPTRIQPTNMNIDDTNTVIKFESSDNNSLQLCPNSACRAILNIENSFCKRCSCCICYTYDDNKDPSLWLVCSNINNPSEFDSCGTSCHIDCAMHHENSGIMKKTARDLRMDGTFYCVSCGKINDLLGFLRKQLQIAKDARRVDVLFYRIFLSHELLIGTEKYQALLRILDEAVKKLESEVGSIDSLNTMARLIVNRLSSGAQVQKLCASALELLDSIIPDAPELFSSGHHDEKKHKSYPLSASVEDITSTSLNFSISHDAPVFDSVSYTLRCRKIDDVGNLTEPLVKHLKLKLNQKYLVSELSPATKYMFSVTALYEGSDRMDELQTGVKMKGITKNGDDPNSSPRQGILTTNREDCLDSTDPTPETADVVRSSSEDLDDVNKICQEEAHGLCVSALDEEHSNPTIQAPLISKNSSNLSDLNQVGTQEKSLSAENNMAITFEQSESVLPVTPSKLEEAAANKLSSKSAVDDGAKNRSLGMDRPIQNKNGGCSEGNYEYCVKVVRWLECTGHMETKFRVKFLTWFSLRATSQERRIVSVFIDTLIDDPPSLVSQLVDTFSEGISNNKRSNGVLSSGFCTRLFH